MNRDPDTHPESGEAREGIEDAATTAFSQLQPNDVIGAMEELDFRCDGRLLALNSYENRVYKVGIEDDEPVVAKFYRPERWSDAAILEEHAFAKELAELDIPLVAPLKRQGKTLHRCGLFRLAVTPCRPGRAPELDDDGLLEQVGRLVARIHLHGESAHFQDRPQLDIESFGWTPVDYLLDEGFIPADVEPAYEGLAEHVLSQVETCFNRAGNVRDIRLHGDFHPGNVLVQDEQLYIVDLDDARTGPAIQDLWMFLSGDREEQTPQLTTLLEGYQQFRHFDARELHLIEALRSLRIMHYAAWLARRWGDPAFKQAFPWFDSRRYWDEHILTLREQLALMQEPPLAWST